MCVEGMSTALRTVNIHSRTYACRTVNIHQNISTTTNVPYDHGHLHVCTCMHTCHIDCTWATCRSCQTCQLGATAQAVHHPHVAQMDMQFSSQVPHYPLPSETVACHFTWKTPSPPVVIPGHLIYHITLGPQQPHSLLTTPTELTHRPHTADI